MRNPGAKVSVGESAPSAGTKALSALCAAILIGWFFHAEAADTCPRPIATLVSVQGGVELRRPAREGFQETGWQPAALNAVLCAGDTIRVHHRSRAALLLNNETTLRLDEATSLTLVGPDEKVSLLQMFSGALHVITRTGRPFRVTTPFINANVEGTEFLVVVDKDRGSVAVFEGVVIAENSRGRVVLADGERATAEMGAAPRKEVLVRPRDAVQWTLYYPAVTDYRLGTAILQTSPEAAIAFQDSIRSYRGGKVAEAIVTADRVPEESGNAQFFIYRAGLLLEVGRLKEAKVNIALALKDNPRSSDAYALQSVIAVVENDKDMALELATRSVELDPASAPARIALSYALQAQFKIDAASAAAGEAADLDPENALAWARLAELRMSLGDLDHALVSAKRAVELNPQLAKTQTVLGFASLIQIDTAAAKTAFNRAIELDQADPLPRLGLGLAKIREGDLQAGRQEIEIATSLDPGRSLVRSYLGKAYYEEKRDKLAGAQFAQAEELDSKDPTPWFYDAISKQTQNRLVEALQDLERSTNLNDNRAVYRSKLLLDQDQAARRVNQARIYQDLGFEQLALVEGYKSLAEDPGNASAHRLLADAYSNLPRHDIARVSEALQAQLRQPLSLPYIDPRISSDNLFILREAGPSRLGANEFNLLFNRDQTRARVDGIAGNHGTVGDQAIVSGLADGIAYAASQLHYETEGFRENNAVRKDFYELFVQDQLSPKASVQVDFRRSKLRTGQTFFDFDPDFRFPTTISQDSDYGRLGGRYQTGAESDLIWAVMYEDKSTASQTVPDGFAINQDTARTLTAEIQYLLRLRELQLVAGVGRLETKDQFVDGSNIKSDSTNAYAYGHWKLAGYALDLEAGAAAEFVEIEFSSFSQRVRRHRLSPKAGITWSPITGTTLRAAAFSSVKRPLAANQTIEPTQVSGFNQFFAGFDNFYGDIDGTISRRACIAIDQSFIQSTFAGGEFALRRLAVPSVINDRDFDWKEKTGRLYLYKAYGPADTAALLPGWQASVSLDYEYERIDRPQAFSGSESIEQVTTERLPLGATLFSPSGWSIGLATAYVRQRGLFSVDVGLPEFPKRDRAWLTDFFLSYRLPGRAGILSIGARNVFDKSIDVFNTDPANPRIPTRRFLFAKASLGF